VTRERRGALVAQHRRHRGSPRRVGGPRLHPLGPAEHRGARPRDGRRAGAPALDRRRALVGLHGPRRGLLRRPRHLPPDARQRRGHPRGQRVPRQPPRRRAGRPAGVPRRLPRDDGLAHGARQDPLRLPHAAGEAGRVTLQDDTIYLGLLPRHRRGRRGDGRGALGAAGRRRHRGAHRDRQRGLRGVGHGQGARPRARRRARSRRWPSSARASGRSSLDGRGARVPAGGTAPEGSVREQLVAMVRDATTASCRFARTSSGCSRASRTRTSPTTCSTSTRSGRSPCSSGRASPRRCRRGATARRSWWPALQEHYDYLEGRQAPPLQVIAPTLVADGRARRGAGAPLAPPRPRDPAGRAARRHQRHRRAGRGERRCRRCSAGCSSTAPTATFAASAVALNTANDAIFRHGDAAAHEWLRARAQDTSVPTEARTRIDELFARAATDAQAGRRRRPRASAQEALQDRAQPPPRGAGRGARARSATRPSTRCGTPTSTPSGSARRAR
jgi:hypothetical protein